MRKKMKIPKFKNEDEERKFWTKLDLAKFFVPSDFQSAVFPNLKPSSRPISLRIPSYLLIRIKEQANELNVPYQSLMKEYIAEGVWRKSMKK